MRKTITWVLYILMGVQIVLGCVYLVGNFGVTQQFRENLDFFLPTGAVCLIQLVLAGISVWYVLGKFGFQENGYVRGYVCAFLLTVPYLLQMHMARLVWSAALSVFLWMFGLIVETVKSGLSGRRALLLLATFLLYGVICPDGLWLGIFLLSGIFFFSGGRRGEDRQAAKAEKGRRRPGTGFLFGAAVLLTAVILFAANRGLNKIFPQERAIYRENNLGVTAVSRLAWPNLGKNYYFWSEDVKAVLTEDEAVWISWREDLVGEEFYPKLVETYGERKATKLCLEMGVRCLKDRTRETVLEIGRDFRDYLLLPFTIEGNLKGRGSSLTAWNYGRMRENTPVLVKYYYRYGTFELGFLLLGSFLLWSFRRNERIGRFLRERASGERPEGEFRRTENGGRLPVQWKFAFYTLILYTIWYTLRSNLPIDYKLALPVLFVWYLMSVGGLLCRSMGE